MSKSIESTTPEIQSQSHIESKATHHPTPHHHHHLHHIHHTQHKHPTTPHHHHHIVHHHHHPPHQHHNHNHNHNHNHKDESKPNENTESMVNHTTKLSNTRHIPKLNMEPIESIIKELFPYRKFLGTIIYNPTTTWETLQTSSLYGISKPLQQRFKEIKKNYKKRLSYNKRRNLNFTTRYIPIIPPLPKEYINSIIEIKIPFRYIIEFKQDLYNGLLKREIWGGASGIYTDDSNILQVLLHLGFFNDTIDLSTWNKKWSKKDIIKPIYFENFENFKIKNHKRRKINENDGRKDEIKENTENRETKHDIQNIDDKVYGDLSIEILLLPPLPSYHGFFNNGINSRSWNLNQNSNDFHNGLSFAVYNIKWDKRNSYLQNKLIYNQIQAEDEEDEEEDDDDDDEF
ncbi:uncharacterized protein KGF55_001968 [Candida pseudojiufengensis]|uniref:uncharacterized protein n=1 Tax=Candida pseudojiufengensis TaxID=497109 RepID=UPI002225B00F|nr:uncharacterized protein KGF55_001968 [Candida pseudojiufengensis]KAI5964897.1 hypothetical protein KGF55_001968 [Candida pseudojiufengensis]